MLIENTWQKHPGREFVHSHCCAKGIKMNRKFVIVSVLVFATTVYEGLLFECPSSEYVYKAGFCFLFADVTATWRDAQAYCQAKNGNVVFANSLGEGEVLRDLLGSKSIIFAISISNFSDL